MKWITLILLMLVPAALQAGDTRDFDYGSFAHIPILHEGRIKPLDSFARITLRKAYGKAALPDESADKWLAGVLFAPADAAQQRIFLVHDVSVIPMLSLSKRADNLYSFEELAGIFAVHQSYIASLMAKDRKTLLPFELEMIRLYENVNDVADIMGSFSLLLPIPDADVQVHTMLGLPAGADVTYVDLLKIKHEITDTLAGVVKRKGDKIKDYTPHEQALAGLSYRMNLLDEMSGNNTLLRVIPPAWSDSEEWLSPWAVIKESVGSPQSAELFNHWHSLAIAYTKADAAAWKQSTDALLAHGKEARGVRPYALSLEVMYNAVSPLQLSLIGYAWAAVLALAGMLMRKPVLLLSAYRLAWVSAFVHGAGIAARMAILLRPPVSTLYESMIFVSLVAAVFGLLTERKHLSGEGLLLSAIISALLLVAANVFAGDSDTLEVLVAVLNTNFWLATHVVCITTGYGSALFAGMLAHLYLLKRIRGADADALNILQKRLHAVALIALLFTAIGTMLGGIWADQSWGRFWGWDPKENGALWIVLWLVWLVHGRLAGQLGERGFALAAACLNIVVALAWVGVNLLSVGLHSYGFTSAAANSLIAFCGIEAGLIMLAACMLYLRKQDAYAP